MSARPPRRRRAVTLTPLIDVIFLLLLFFMLTATFTREGELPLAAAAGSGAALSDRPAFLQVGADGLRLDREPVPPGGLGAALRAAGARAVVVSFAADADAQALVAALAALAALPDLSVALLE